MSEYSIVNSGLSGLGSVGVMENYILNAAKLQILPIMPTFLRKYRDPGAYSPEKTGIFDNISWTFF